MRSPTHRLHRASLMAVALLAFAPARVDAAAAPGSSARVVAAEERDEAMLRVAQAQQPTPLVVGGPVRASAGSTTSFPVSLRPGAPAEGRYVVVMKAPEWLSFSMGEQVGNGIWLLDRDKLAKVEMKLAANAAGSHDLSVGLGGKSGGIQGISDLRVEVGAAAAPAPATVAQAPAPKPATPPAGNAVTWESLVGGKKPAAPAPAPAAAAPSAAKPAAGNKTDAQLIQEAKHLVRECTTCHNLYGQDVGIPVMVGLTVDRFLDTMDLYKRDKRDNKIMQVISKSLSDEETRALALYLSRIKPAVQTDTAALGGAPAGDPAKQAQEPIALSVKSIDDERTRARVVRWLKRGEQMLNDGDIAQARLLLERATEFGDARAAFLMATSFDPNALPWRSNVGMVAEPLTARRWYLTAKNLGAGAEADQRLAELPAPR